ncbi:SEC-C metal-binding domain-containing protein, partial [Planobispora siamensis]
PLLQQTLADAERILGEDHPLTGIVRRNLSNSQRADAELARSAASSERTAYGDVERNAVCRCGSGKKYKRCHGAPTAETGAAK